MKSAREYFHDGDLAAALGAAAEELRDEPASTGKRAFYAELLCLHNDLDKADGHLQTLASLQPKTLVTVGTWRQLIRAAQHRHEVFHNGAVPDTVEAATSRIRAQLELLVAVREGDAERAAEQCAALEEGRAPHPAVVNGEPVEDLRDLDDLAAGILEVLGSNGKYFWIDFAQIQALRLHAPERPLDLLWRPAELQLTTGTVGQVFIPAIYPTPTSDPQALLGRKTDWQDLDGAVRGIGQRSWLVGDQALAFAEVDSVEAAESQQQAVAI